MQVEESRQLLLSDTLVPDVFILEYLAGLDGLAVKTYLMLLFVSRSGRQIGEKDLARRLGVEVEEMRTALVALAAQDLVTLKERSVEIRDIKAHEIERTYRPKTASSPTEVTDSKRDPQREKLLRAIAGTFFQGLMSPSWLMEIDAWLDRFAFTPEVVLALFQECARRGKLENKAYIRTVAENWHKHSIRTFEDLNRYSILRDRVHTLSRKIGRKLHRNMTEYDEEMVARWLEEYGYDFEIIDQALRRTTRAANPNLEFIDRLLREWHAHDLRSAESVIRYEVERAGRGAHQTGRDRANRGNFVERQYSADYLAGFETDLSALVEPEKGSEHA